MRLLLEHGADPNAKGGGRESPLDEAIWRADLYRDDTMGDERERSADILRLLRSAPCAQARGR